MYEIGEAFGSNALSESDTCHFHVMLNTAIAVFLARKPASCQSLIASYDDPLKVDEFAYQKILYNL